MEARDTQASSQLTTLLFTDIEGSTRLWEQDGQAMSRALALHDRLSRAAVEENRGSIVKMTGDGMYAAFGDPLDALAATLALQLGLDEQAASLGTPLRVRAGLHLGVVERRDDDLFGSPVNRAARIMKAAHGGQVLLSQAVCDRVRERLPEAVALRDLGSVRLRDLASSEHVYQLVHPALRQDFPALRSPRRSACSRTRGSSRCSGWAGSARRGSPCRSAPTCWSAIPTASGSSISRRSATRRSCRTRPRTCWASARSPASRSCRRSATNCASTRC
jgi:class 3 adenylate cyclase